LYSMRSPSTVRWRSRSCRLIGSLSGIYGLLIAAVTVIDDSQPPIACRQRMRNAKGAERNEKSR
jgi:hypothetical protein